MSILGGESELLSGRLGNFEFVGSGGSGSVYRADDALLGRTVAVKVLTLAGRDAHRALTEGRAQAAVSWHSNVVSLHGSGHTPDGAPYLVLEFAEGGSLADRVAASGPLEPASWLDLAEQLASALAAAHELGVVHCDVKASNVLFAADGSVRLADFGIARTDESTGNTIDQFEGSLAFAPPEMLEGASPRPANDVYGLALVIYYAATGRFPFGSYDQSPAALVAKIQSTEVSFDDVPGVPLELVALLDRCADPDPDRRPAAAEVGRRIAACGSAGRAPETGQHRARREVRTRWELVPPLLLVIALIATVLTVSRWSAAASPAVDPVPDICEEFARMTERRLDLFAEVSSDLEQSQTPVDVVERLLVHYPADFARAVRPMLASVAAANDATVQISDSQMAQMSQATVFQALTGGKAFYFDGQSGEFDPGVLPRELQEPARIFSEANQVAIDRCAVSQPDFAAAKARMYSAIFSNLGNPGFMEGFFSDPRSIALFDKSTVALMASMARGFFESLLEDDWDWFFELLERDEPTRLLFARDYPDLFLTAVAADPSLLPILAEPTWLDPVREGLARSSPAARHGAATLFAEQLAALELEPADG